MANCIAFQLVCAEHDTSTCQFSNAKSGLMRGGRSVQRETFARTGESVLCRGRGNVESGVSAFDLSTNLRKRFITWYQLGRLEWLRPFDRVTAWDGNAVFVVTRAPVVYNYCSNSGGELCRYTSTSVDDAGMNSNIWPNGLLRQPLLVRDVGRRIQQGCCRCSAP